MPLVGTIDQNTAIQEQIFSATLLGFAPSQEAPQAFADAIVAVHGLLIGVSLRPVGWRRRHLVLAAPSRMGRSGPKISP